MALLSWLVSGRRRRFSPRRPQLECLEDRNLLATFVVNSALGNDANAGSAAAPFQSIQRAINVASNFDIIKVAGGTYVYTPSQDTESAIFGYNAVAFVNSKFLTIIGGYSAADGYANSNPGATPTVINGQGITRGVVVTTSGTPNTAGLSLQNVTIQNGFGASTGTGVTPLLGAGGGLQDIASGLSVSGVTFINNSAVGGNSSSGMAGPGAGGGAGIFSPVGTVTLTNLTFTSNNAVGGNGPTGGFGQGGGLFVSSGTVTATNLLFQGNTATGGVTTTNVGTGGTADGTGGAAAFINSTTTLVNYTAMGNTVTGGAAASAGATPGGAFGGGLYVENGNLSLTDGLIQSNLAMGGSGGSGTGSAARLAAGAGVNLTNANASIVQAAILLNNAVGGGGAVQDGSPSGGGIDAFSGTPNSNTLVLTNDLVANNTITFGAGSSETGGGAGAGVDLNGTMGTFDFLTLAANQFANATVNLQGQAIAVRSGANLTLNNSIIANHVNSLSLPGAALDVFQGSAVTLGVNLFAGNTKNDNSDNNPNTAGSFTGLSNSVLATSAGFLNAGANDYRLSTSSPAIGKAVADGTTVDINAFPRATPPSLGAFELNSPMALPAAATGATSSTTPPPPPGQTPTPPGAATMGAFDPSTGTWFLRLSNGAGAPDIAPFVYGLPGWKAVVGDWDGNGSMTPGVVDPATNTWFLRNESSGGIPDAGVFQYGAPGWIPISGDWFGTGHDGIGAVDPTTMTWYLRNESSPGLPDAGVFQFGLPGWIPIVGKWDGVHVGIGAFDPSTATFYLRSTSSAGAPNIGVFQYGAPGWIPIAGDFGNTGMSGIGVVNPATETFYLRNSPSAGPTSYTPFAYGAPGWTPLAGRFIVGGAPTDAQVTSPSFSDNTAPLAAALVKLNHNSNTDPLDALFTDGV
jgi:hypothetical protein